MSPSEFDLPRLLLVALAGAVGTGARFALASLIGVLFGTVFPYGTIVVNVVGSFLMGVVVTLSAAGDAITPTTRLVLTTGFLGGFTTYSAFNNETIALLEANLWGRALANVVVTLLVCLAAGLAGAVAVRRLGA